MRDVVKILRDRLSGFVDVYGVNEEEDQDAIALSDSVLVDSRPSEPELLPCICGSTRTHTWFDRDEERHYRACNINIDVCGWMVGGESPSACDAAWNRRTPGPATARIIEDVKAERPIKSAA